jgi:hypothetical protein
MSTTGRSDCRFALNLMEKVMQTLFGLNARKSLLAMAATVLLATLGGSGPTQAYTVTNYTNAVLNGCYSHLGTSVDTTVGTNKTQVGTICFDGAGHIINVAGPINQTGQCQNTNGIVTCNTAAGTGTYSLAATNTPGHGMGTFSIVIGPCTFIHNFAVNSVDTFGVAHGFQYALEKKTGPLACHNGPDVVGGTAWLQQP